MAKEPMRNIETDEAMLNNLMKEMYDNLKDDSEEAQRNVDEYFKLIEAAPQLRDQFGAGYNDSLKIKGSVRDKQLKFLGMFKDRVTKKEDRAVEEADKKGGSNLKVSTNHITDIISDMKKNGELKNVEINIEDKKEGDGEERD